MNIINDEFYRKIEIDPIIETIRKKHLHKKTMITSSGDETNFYFDIKSAFFDKSINRKLVIKLASEINSKVVLGLESGSIPIVSQLSLIWNYAHTYGYIRKDQRDHGLKKLIEGLDELN